MTLYNYKRFLGDSDKLVKKYFNLKKEVKEREIFRKIGLEDFFKPITSIISKEERKEGKEERKEGKEERKEGEEENKIEEVKEENKIEEVKEENKIEEDSEYDDNPPEYGKTLYFENLNELYDAYPKKRRSGQDFFDAYLNVISREYNYKKDLNLNNLSNKELNTKKQQLNKLLKSTKNQSKYNNKIEEIDKNVRKQKIEILEILDLRKRMKNNGIWGRGGGIGGRGGGIGGRGGRIGGRGGIGKGIKGGNNSLIYYNNPQQLIDRLKLLVGSKRAGNTNPEIDNEIIGISDELVKKGLIMNYDYTNFMNKNSIKF